NGTVLAYQSLGVVYGDLATSPVNAFSSTRLNNLSEEDLLGTLSLIIWTLTFLDLLSALKGIQSRSSKITQEHVVCIAEPESPIMLMWFATNVCIGVYNVITYEPSILKAASPHYILKFFVRNGKTAFDLLGAVFLSIRVGFLFRGLSVVILTYAGETAYFTKNPEKITDAYYSSIPENVYWPMFVISTLAAVVSSQFMISATFSIVKQSLSLDCFPRVNIIHTSSKHQGQIYSPEINYILMILTLGLVVGYKGGVELANAYGTVLRSYMGNDHNDVHVGRVHFHDVVIKENPTRRMGSVCISAFFLTVVLSWRYGRIKKTTYEAERKMSIEELDQMLSLNNNIYRTQGICFFFTNLVYGIPPIVQHYIQHTNSVREIMVIVTTEDRYNVGKLGNEGVYRCLVRFGYKDSWNMKEDEYVASVLTELQELTNITTNEEHTTQTAAEKEIVYVVGRTILKANKENGTLARLTIGYLYRFLQKNSRAAVSTLEIPPERTLQIGMTYEI
ncbi:hypothetical protein MIMGU_mgv1a021793mg, partial [Erythranthe guttata]